MNVPAKPLRIDIPVELSDVKVVYSIGELAFEKDLAAWAFHMGLTRDDVAEWKATSDVVAVFHTNAGHATLHDDAYNSDRGIATGNPFKDLLADLMRSGARVELCGATAKSHGYGNEDLLPEILINRNAMARTTQLVQEGFVKMTEG